MYNQILEWVFFLPFLKKVQDIITPYIRTGAWFSPSECCLLSLLASKEAEAVGIILKIRAGEEFGDTSVRPRRTPKINLNASGLQNLIPWKIEDCHEPVFICKLSTSKIRELEDSPLSVPQFSIHTQSTERCVKMVTEAAAAVAGQEGWVHQVQNPPDRKYPNSRARRI